jgi:2-oxoglutarate dehydrogenase E1 component
MKGAYPLDRPGRAADVPYHLGLDTRYPAPAGAMRIRLLPNPSHLEAVNAVALGFARQRQEALGSPKRVLPLILHTDASVVAQGVVSEALQLSGVAGHQVGGALNIVINNQIGFTTEPEEGRSSRYCTGPWKAIDSLIAHVNGDDVDAVLAAADLAFDYRQAFGGESVVDLVCIRANGHNELDEPRFTQPHYYEAAGSKASISTTYAAQLLASGGIDVGHADQVAQACGAELDAASVKADRRDAPAVPETPLAVSPPKGLAAIAALAAEIPTGGAFNPKAVRQVVKRGEEWASRVSWPTAEVLAFGAALSLGWDVRLTGQDVDRGAFSQRHLSLTDTVSGERRRVFETRPETWGAFSVHNTPLCEYAALGFEYGYSVAAERTLTLWEAQFGDFANGAQTVFDQFIASGAEKWGQTSGLVVLLPHGLEGQGPEHSSARIERMLQLAAKDNLGLAHPSTPASYYHLLLSQLGQTPRRPLIIFTPKKLLRLKAAVSAPSLFEAGGFEPVIVDPSREPTSRVLICSGKVYYDLADALVEEGRCDVTLLRLEQLYPFPSAAVTRALATAPDAAVVWVQEEPANFGAWTWLRSRLEDAIMTAGGRADALTLAARPESPSPAGSFHQDHDRDQARLVAEAIGRSTSTEQP